MRYRLDHGGQFFEFRMAIRTSDRWAMENLSARLQSIAEIGQLRTSPTGD
jgi:hypothetical protein